MYFSLFFVTILLVTASKGSQELASPTLKNTVSYNITNLWNGTEDTLSNATDKGGNQVTVKLQGMLLIEWYIAIRIGQSCLVIVIKSAKYKFF